MSTLSESSVLLKVSIGRYSGKKLDKDVSAEIAKSKDANLKSGIYTKFLIVRDAFSEINAVFNETNKVVNFYTSPWYRGGWNIIQTVILEDTLQKLRGLQARFDAAVNAFRDNWPTYVEQSKQASIGLGLMYKAEDYPDINKVIGDFYFTIQVQPLPANVSDFRLTGVSEKALNEFKASYISDQNESMKLAINNTFEKMYKVIEHAAKTLSNPDAGFHKSIIGNIEELVDILPALNFTGDARITKLCEKMKKKFAGVDAQDLRDDAALRQEKANDASAILKSLAGYMGKK